MRGHINAAFTLMEILMVTAILAIAAAVAIPIIGSHLENMRVSAAARMVMYDILLAQSTAVSTQTPTFMFFIKDESGNLGYTIVRFKNDVTPAAPPVGTAKTATEMNDSSNTVFVRSPVARQGCYVAFGAIQPGGFGSSTNCLLNTGTVTGFGFSSIGQPIGISKSDLSAPIVLTINSRNGQIKSTLSLTPITGEIEVDP